jgi:FlaA1/EpsC-like NDP-sugar epimerase
MKYPNPKLGCKAAVRNLIGGFLDLSAFLVCGIAAFELRFDFSVPEPYRRAMFVSVAVWVCVKSTAFPAAGLDRRPWRYASAEDAWRVFLVNSAGSLISAAVLLVMLGAHGVPRSVYVSDWLLCSASTAGDRLAAGYLASSQWAWRNRSANRARTLIYGAGSAGLMLARELAENHSLPYELAGLVDDDPSKTGLKLMGRRVLGTGNDLPRLAGQLEIEHLLIAMPSASPSQMVRILQLANDADLQYKIVPGLGELIAGSGLGKQLRDVAVEDLLGRKPVQLDQDHLSRCLQGRVVMVTGAAGSIGSEICRQIARFHPRFLVGFDNSETPLFNIERELRRTFPHLRFHPEIGSITDPRILNTLMERDHPAVIYHAAAYKHVPMMEKNVFAAVENNIFGTWTLAQAAIRHGVENFVLISTDKAVRPASVMGATKRVAELAIRSLQNSHATRFAAVRFGNVLGSNGSVVPIFKEQIAAGGPVTVTDPEMRRFFMTIPEAAQLVLQAFSISEGGEIFVLDMGEPVRIVDLARNLILLSGLSPDRDVRIEFTGLRPGEKLVEELQLQEESLVRTTHPKIRRYVSPAQIGSVQMANYLHTLRDICHHRDVGQLILLMKELVADYNPGFEVLRQALGSNSTSAAAEVALVAAWESDLAATAAAEATAPTR